LKTTKPQQRVDKINSKKLQQSCKIYRKTLVHEKRKC